MIRWISLNLHVSRSLTITTLMRVAPNWDVFEMLFDKAFPAPNTQIEMALDEEGKLWSAIEEHAE
jgi:hypothetical protein